MNTDIEFRGLRADGQGWVYGFLIRNEKISGIIPSYEISFTCNGNALDFGYIEVIPESVGQFHKSLSEKTRGKRVYVGDIILFDLVEGLGEPKKFNCTQVIETIGVSSSWCTNVRVVGNIHENK